MPGDATVDPAGVIVAGLGIAVEVSGDATLAAGGARIFASVREALAPDLHPEDRATIVVPCVRMADRNATLLIVLQDRAMLAWASGVHRKKPHVETMPLRSSWGATVAPGTGARQPIKVLTVQWDEGAPWVVAVPSDSATTRLLRECFIAK